MIATVRGAGSLELFPSSAAARVFSTRRHGIFCWPKLRLKGGFLHGTWQSRPQYTKKNGYDMDMTWVPSGNLTFCNGKIHHAING